MSSSKYATYPSLRGKRILISGGAEGMGASCVRMFYEQGAIVTFLDYSPSSAQKLLDSISSSSSSSSSSTQNEEGKEKPPLPKFIPCDVTSLEQLQTAATQAGPTDILINNAASAGANSRVASEKVTPESWDYDVNVNLRHYFFLTQAVVPAMRESGKGGNIINMGSITWRIPATGSPVYTLCKAAIMGMTRTHSKEFGRWGIRVNSVMPGSVATERQIEEVLTDEYRKEVWDAQSFGRDVVPDEVARLVLFLAADDSSAITGSSYVADGGWVSDP
ncbi:NAD(P)-binding protein [Poronia punctata]|nr:NAD(P)-binding protein [Poronia punctata]